MLEQVLAFDFLFSQLLQSFANPALDLFFQAVSFLGHPVFWIAVIAWFYWKGKEKQAVNLMNLMLFASIIVQVLKEGIARARPQGGEFRIAENDFLNNYSSEFSFPSGHSTLISGFFAFFYSTLKKNWSIAFAVAIVLVAVSRIYLGMHFFTDVIAGIILGLAVGKFNFWFSKRTEKMHFKISMLREEALLFAIVIIALIIGFFLQEFLLFSIFLGYYAGYSLFKELNLKQEKFSKTKYLTGFSGTGIIVVLGFALANSIAAMACLFLAGFWISFLFPALWEKLATR